jgi:hypothetical protein
VFGLAFVPRVWLDVPADATEESNPGIAIRQSCTAALGFGLILGVAFGFIADVAGVSSLRNPASVPRALVVG